MGWSDWYSDRLIPLGLVEYTPRYQAALDMLVRHPDIQRIVGHSLGAVVAKTLATQIHVPYDVYANPAVSWNSDPHDHRHYYDLVSVLDRGATSTTAKTWDFHDFRD